MSETTKENVAPVPETMLDELLDLTDTDRKAVARAVAVIKLLQPSSDADMRKIIREELDRDHNRFKKFWQKVTATINGLLKDSEL